MTDKMVEPADVMVPKRILPYMNLEDLTTDPKTPLIFLNARGRNPLHTFAMMERMFMPNSSVKDDFVRVLKVRLNDEETYQS